MVLHTPLPKPGIPFLTLGSWPLDSNNLFPAAQYYRLHRSPRIPADNQIPHRIALQPFRRFLTDAQ